MYQLVHMCAAACLVSMSVAMGDMQIEEAVYASLSLNCSRGSCVPTATALHLVHTVAADYNNVKKSKCTATARLTLVQISCQQII